MFRVIISKIFLWINVLPPGVMDAEMTMDLLKDKILPLIPGRRFGTAAEVASIVVCLYAK